MATWLEELQIVKKDGLHLRDVPERMRDPHMCEVAVKQNPLALRYVPVNDISHLMCELAVLEDGLMLEFVPEHMRSENTCRLAIAGSKKNAGRVLRMIPLRVLSPDIFMIAVKEDGRVLGDIPEFLRSADLCVAAVENDAEALRYVPDSVRKSGALSKFVVPCVWAVEEPLEASESMPPMPAPDYARAAECAHAFA